MSNITLSQALDIFEENIDEIELAAKTNTNARVAELNKPSFGGDYNLFWVKSNVYLYRLEAVTEPARRLLRLIKLNRQPKTTGLINEDDIARAKQTPIESILPSELVRGYACCPLHKEKTPSFHVRKNNTFMCFGCQEYGDVIDLYQKLNNCTFIEAVKALK